MVTTTASFLNEPAKGALEAIQQIHQEGVTNLVKMAARQVESFKVYSNLGVGQLQAAIEVRDFEGLQALISQQTDVLTKATERLVADVRAFAELGIESVSEARKPIAEAAPEAPAKVKAA